MTTLFHHAAVVQPATFGLGIYTTPERPARPRPYTSLDQCWYAGFAAGREDGTEALPPSHYDDDQCFAWHQGHSSAVCGGDEGADWDHGQLDEMAEQAELQELHERGIKVF